MQIPNFGLAFPTLLLSFAAIRRYFKHDPARFLSLGNLGTPKMLARLRRMAGPPAPATEVSDSSAPLYTRERVTGFVADDSFVFVAQLAAMALFAALIMHIQARYCCP